MIILLKNYKKEYDIGMEQVQGSLRSILSAQLSHSNNSSYSMKLSNFNYFKIMSDHTIKFFIYHIQDDSITKKEYNKTRKAHR